jgi:hypothetical protein
MTRDPLKICDINMNLNIGYLEMKYLHSSMILGLSFMTYIIDAVFKTVEA